VFRTAVAFAPSRDSAFSRAPPAPTVLFRAYCLVKIRWVCVCRVRCVILNFGALRYTASCGITWKRAATAIGALAGNLVYLLLVLCVRFGEHHRHAGEGLLFSSEAPADNVSRCNGIKRTVSFRTPACFKCICGIVRGEVTSRACYSHPLLVYLQM
jgi:hypothetical protein